MPKYEAQAENREGKFLLNRTITANSPQEAIDKVKQWFENTDLRNTGATVKIFDLKGKELGGVQLSDPITGKENDPKTIPTKLKRFVKLTCGNFEQEVKLPPDLLKDPQLLDDELCDRAKDFVFKNITSFAKKFPKDKPIVISVDYEGEGGNRRGGLKYMIDPEEIAQLSNPTSGGPGMQ